MNRITLSSVTRIAAALSLAALPATADVLVTRDGATVTTQGAWRVDGRRVVFTLPNGQLSSLRTDDVDLDRSAAATAEAAQAAMRPAAEATIAPSTAEPVLRLTEKDFPPVSESGEPESPDAGDATAGAAASSVPLEVASWDRVPLDSGEGLQIFGTLRNTGQETVISPGLSVSVYGEEGGLLAMTEASVNLTAIPAGKSANFRAELPGLPDFAAARFSPSGRGYASDTPSAGEADAPSLPDSADAGVDESLDTATESEPPVD